MENRRPHQTVTVTYGEDPSAPSSSSTTVAVVSSASSSSIAAQRLQFESECVETKTVTTTTTTKRTFPPLFIREPRPLDSLDAVDYPLAATPVPPELAKFTFEVPSDMCFSGSDGQAQEDGKVLSRLDTNTVDGNSGFGRLFTRAGNPSDVSSRRTPRASLKDQTSTARSRASHRQAPPVNGLRRSIIHTSRGTASSERPRPGVLATPDTSEIATGNRVHLAQQQQSTPDDHAGLAVSFDAASPAGSDFQAVCGGNGSGSGSVSTPPIDAENELADMDDSLQASIRSSQRRPTIDIAAAQDAALPSPRLSPTLASSHPQHSSRSRALYSGGEGEDEDSQPYSADRLGATSSWMEEDTQMEEADGLGLVHTPTKTTTAGFSLARGGATFNTKNMLEAFDSMPDRMQKFMMYQLLRRCTRSTLRVVATAVNPILKRDFLRFLPAELRYQVLSYLDSVDLCRAARVSKHWRQVVDCNETIWKELFDRDGFCLEEGELERAIVQGWGWQDPVGLLDHEKDLVALANAAAVETGAKVVEAGAQAVEVGSNAVKAGAKAVEAETKPERGSRAAKRKREANNSGGDGGVPARSKRRAGTADHSHPPRSLAVAEESSKDLARWDPSAGPMSAAGAAIAAVPDPGPALQDPFPTLRRMHLYKSLYRRHHMMQRSWTSGKVLPGHLAFTAHPRQAHEEIHVITCLQFDEDKIVTGSDDMQIHIYGTKTGVLRKKLEGHEGGVWALQYHGNTLVSGSTDRTVRVWDMERGVCTQVFYAHTSTVRCLQIVMPVETGRVKANGQPVTEPEMPLIITGSRDHTLRVWELPSATSKRFIESGPPANESDCPFYKRTLAGHTNSVRAIAAHADTVVSGSYDGTVRVWNISSGKQRHVLTGHGQKVYSVVLDPKRNRCISGSMDSLVKMWDLATGACLYTLEGHSLLVGLLDLRGDRLVSAAADSTLRVWDPENGRCRNVLTAHTGAITCFQHDARKIISGSDKTVKMWDVVSGDCVHDLLSDLGVVWQVKFNHRRCVAAVQRDNVTYVEVLDFGAVRDGVPLDQLGVRTVLNEDDLQRIHTEETPVQQPQQ